MILGVIKTQWLLTEGSLQQRVNREKLILQLPNYVILCFLSVVILRKIQFWKIEYWMTIIKHKCKLYLIWKSSRVQNVDKNDAEEVLKSKERWQKRMLRRRLHSIIEQWSHKIKKYPDHEKKGNKLVKVQWSCKIVTVPWKERKTGYISIKNAKTH